MPDQTRSAEDVERVRDKKKLHSIIIKIAVPDRTHVFLFAVKTRVLHLSRFWVVLNHKTREISTGSQVDQLDQVKQDGYGYETGSTNEWT